MADLNLIPNPQLMLAQAALFLSNLYIVKKLMIEPFLELKAVRDGLTLGAEHEAETMKKECVDKSAKLYAHLEKADVEAKLFKLQEKNRAKKEKEQVIREAHSTMEGILRGARDEIKQDFEQERAKVDQYAKKLLGEIEHKIIA